MGNMKVKNYLETLNHGDLKNLKNKLTDMVDSKRKNKTDKQKKTKKHKGSRRSKNVSQAYSNAYDSSDQNFADKQDVPPPRKKFFDMQDTVSGIWDYRVHIGIGLGCLFLGAWKHEAVMNIPILGQIFRSIIGLLEPRRFKKHHPHHDNEDQADQADATPEE